MDTENTQYTRESHLTVLYCNGSILHKADGVHFKSQTTQLCRLPWDINYDGLKEKLTPKVQLVGDEQEITGIYYRCPSMGDHNLLHFSSKELKNDEDVLLMRDTHEMFKHRLKRPLELNVLTRRTVASILSRLPLPPPTK